MKFIETSQIIKRHEVERENIDIWAGDFSVLTLENMFKKEYDTYAKISGTYSSNYFQIILRDAMKINKMVIVTSGAKPTSILVNTPTRNGQAVNMDSVYSNNISIKGTNYTHISVPLNNFENIVSFDIDWLSTKQNVYRLMLFTIGGTNNLYSNGETVVKNDVKNNDIIVEGLITATIDIKCGYNASATQGMLAKFYSYDDQIGITGAEPFYTKILTFTAPQSDVQDAILLDVEKIRQLRIQIVNQDLTYDAEYDLNLKG